jgi:hypothetical protein
MINTEKWNKLDNNQRGDLVKALVEFDLVNQGFEVARVVASRSAYDFMVSATGQTSHLRIKAKAVTLQQGKYLTYHKPTGSGYDILALIYGEKIFYHRATELPDAEEIIRGIEIEQIIPKG